MANNAPFPIQPELTSIAIAYKNPALIADNVLPYVPVGKQEFKYLLYPQDENFTIPETKVGRTSRPNKVEFTATEQTSATVDYALDDPIPQADIENAPVNYDPLARATEGIMNLIKLDREVRAANLVFNASNYGTNNKVTLSGTSQFSDFANSDPLNVLLTGLDACIMRPNIVVMGQAVWTKLRQHPKIVKAVLGNSGDSGAIKKDALAELLEVEAVFIGQGFVNTARKGQTASISRVWGKHISMIYRDQLASADRGVTFGYTARFGNPIAGSQVDPNIGMRGGVVVRAGESVKELITANDLGYMIVNAVA